MDMAMFHLMEGRFLPIGYLIYYLLGTSPKGLEVNAINATIANALIQTTYSLALGKKI